MTDDTKRSWEFAAIPLTLVLLGILFVVLAAASAGATAFVALGIVGALAVVLVAVWYMRRAEHPRAPKEPALPDGAPQHVDDGVHRILVIADDACTPADLSSAIAAHRTTGVTEAFVVAPVLGSRTARWTSDEHAYVEAGKHLEATVSALGELDVAATGRVGSHDPLQATEDGLREFAADEIVLAVHPEGEANWLEAGVAAEAQARYPLPVTVVTVPAGDREQNEPT